VISQQDMGDFLGSMAAASRARVDEAREREPASRLQARVGALAAPPRLKLDGRFDLIAELKLRSPAYGVLTEDGLDIATRVEQYARGGAAAVSVLTEPTRFDGALTHLAEASRALAPFGVPTMRKDFLVDTYQVLEARLHGAGGVLLIIRMLPERVLRDMMMAAAQLGLFVLLEAFDQDDLAVAHRLAREWSGRSTDCLIGVNSRDLVTLQVVPDRLETLVAGLPDQHPRVAESGLQSAADAARLSRVGYGLALVGSALMSGRDPEGLVREMIDAGRAVVKAK
jgi:indole-3-glycerol phosphate synthase